MGYRVYIERTDVKSDLNTYDVPNGIGDDVVKEFNRRVLKEKIPFRAFGCTTNQSTVDSIVEELVGNSRRQFQNS